MTADTPDPRPVAQPAERELLAPLDREEYPVGSVVRVEDMTPLERAWAEAEHDGCEEEPIGHPLSAHAPWSGGDLDGVETWPSFMARLARHGLTLRLSGDDEGLRDAAAEVVRFYGTDRTWSLTYRTLLGSRIDDLEAALYGTPPATGEPSE